MATQNSGGLASLESTLQEYFLDKAPYQLPKNAKEAIVKFAPWITIIVILLALPAVLALFGLGAVLSPAMMLTGQSLGMLWWVSTALLAVSVVLELMALPGLFNRTMQGWRYVFYSQLVSIVSSLLMMNIVGAILSAIIGFYILFQVKEMYR